MENSGPGIWLVIATAVASGAVTSLLVHALLGLPLVRVKVRHDARVDRTGNATVLSYVAITNVRGRPVMIDAVFILKRRPMGALG